eukprot:Tamp_23841.p2 GENE.Tamp_23841~~Tamp_23841.p2  ORF type:complete len:124 (-),score=8.54 Tamp_23841:286-657(-)
MLCTLSLPAPPRKRRTPISRVFAMTLLQQRVPGSLFGTPFPTNTPPATPATPATPTPTADLASTADGGAVEETVVQSAFAQRRVPVASRPAEPLPPLASLHLSCEISAPDSEDGVQQDEVCGL